MTDLLRDRVVAAVGDLYEIEAELGRGGMAAVYLARDVRLRRRVAIKVLPPDLAFRADVRTRFLREAETAAQLGHPNIVPIYSVDERDGLVYFAMAYINGESLAVRLAREPRPPLDFVRRTLHAVADALGFAHTHGVVHRDIKPDNILLDRDSGRPVVTDFGIARAAEADSRLTVTGVAVGTPAYMSPEQALGEREIDGRSDLYSLGVVGYQMLTGELPFKATNTPSMLMKHVGEALVPLRERRADLPPDLSAAVERALMKEPSRRWQSAADFIAGLDGHGPAAAYDPAGERARTQWSDQPPPPPASPAARDWRFDPLPPYPVMPPLGPNPQEWRAARRHFQAQERMWRAEVKARRKGDDRDFDERPIEERLRIFRREFWKNGALIAFLATINVLTVPGFLWFLFPAFAMTIRIVTRAGSLWSDGVRVRDLLRAKSPPHAIGAPAQRELQAASARNAIPDPLPLAPADVMRGPYGGLVDRASRDRSTIIGIIDRLSPDEKSMLPEVLPTIEALAARVAELAQTLHRLDADVTPQSIASLERRIEVLSNVATRPPEQERTLSLLTRQRETLGDLMNRRQVLSAQLDSAALVLQNIKLDLLKLRSAGIESSLRDVTSATQEARALSREIGHAIDATAEARSL